MRICTVLVIRCCIDVPETLFDVIFEESKTPEQLMAAKLRGVRAEADLTQTELGALIGIHLNIPPVAQGTISYWETNGSVPGCYLGAITKACKVEHGRLLV